VPSIERQQELRAPLYGGCQDVGVFQIDELKKPLKYIARGYWKELPANLFQQPVEPFPALRRKFSEGAKAFQKNGGGGLSSECTGSAGLKKERRASSRGIGSCHQHRSTEEQPDIVSDSLVVTMGSASWSVASRRSSGSPDRSDLPPTIRPFVSVRKYEIVPHLR